MLLGQLLFLIAAFSIVGATLIGLVTGVGKLVYYKATGRSLAPVPEIGSSDWRKSTASDRVDLGKRSLLTEGVQRSADDPVVMLEGERYRIVRLGRDEFLVTQVTEGRRVGPFELSGEGRYRNVVASPDEPANEKLLVDIALMASLVNRADGRVAVGPDEHEVRAEAHTGSSHPH